ncbi:MAG: hypothetical protein KatS3mg009_2464 [Acidimicrobiia bacterium]|nr:MAG: hypothetical protein KatS3mg009_2464 [Acidimicrobiia bacterium]
MTSRARAEQGVVVARVDGLDTGGLRQLALETVRRLGSGVVVLVGTAADGQKAGVAAAVSKDVVARGAAADALARAVAAELGGRAGGSAEVAAGGGGDTSGVDRALGVARSQAGAWRA